MRLDIPDARGAQPTPQEGFILGHHAPPRSYPVTSPILHSLSRSAGRAPEIENIDGTRTDTRFVYHRPSGRQPQADVGAVGVVNREDGIGGEERYILVAR